MGGGDGQGEGETAPAALLLVAAAAVAPADGDGPGEAHRWRDRAVVHAVERAWHAGDLRAVGALAAGYDALLLQVPAFEDGGELRLSGIGNGERRNRGAFSTPPDYAKALATRALPSLPSRPGLPDPPGSPDETVPRVVDPACGAGALLRAVLARLLAAGLTGDQVLGALHGVDADPVAVHLCRAALAADLTLAGHPCLPEQLESRIVAGDALLGGTPRQAAAGDGVVWHELFGHVLAKESEPAEPVTGWRGGFDAVVANPPWERLKVHARDWGGAPPPGLRGHRAGAARALRDAGRHPLTGTGELNAYLPFVETCWRLLAPEGRAALLVPAGIASDRSAARLVEALAGSGSLARLHLIDPATPIFAGVSGRVGVAVVELTGGPREDDPAPAGQRGLTAVPEEVPGKNGTEVAVGLAGPAEPAGERGWTLTADLLRVVNPNTGTSPLFTSAVDAEIVTAVHRRTPVLLRRDPVTSAVLADAWRLRLVTPLHMTRDAPRFHAAPAEGLLPLWEAKHCGLLDPYGGGTAQPRYWVAEEVVRDRYGDLCERGWLAGYRNVSTTVGPRTLLPTPLPVVAVGNSLPLMSADRLPLLLAALSSLPVDYLLRQKHAGANVNFFKLEQVPVPVPEEYDRPAPWAEGTVADWVLARFARAVVWAPTLGGLAAELAAAGVQVPTGDDPEARASARADLDAAHALLLGLTRAELCHLLETFTALRVREQKQHGRFLTADRVLAAYDRLT